MLLNLLFTIVSLKLNIIFPDYDPPSYTSRDDDDDDDDQKSCFKLPINRECYSLRYWYRGIRYLFVRVKTLMGL